MSEHEPSPATLSPEQGPILCLDTSSKIGVLGLWEAGRTLAEVQVVSRQTASAWLVPLARSILAETGRELSELRAVAVSRGPGYFTGLRVGLSTAVSLAATLEVPLVTLNTLEVIAMNAWPGGRPVLVCLDAQKQQVYWGFYALTPEGPRLLAGPGATGPERVVEALTQEASLVATGAGLALYGAFLADRLGAAVELLPEPLWAARGAWMGYLAARCLARGETTDPAAVEPLYLRPSDAELARTRIKPE
jgi:tRNA threonylcarbamoyladenosine biosynthesis protein TsaB